MNVPCKEKDVNVVPVRCLLSALYLKTTDLTSIGDFSKDKDISGLKI